uniref:Uncharacterized protein n=1 Tax=viral metagenome TaxID=1070528 RepID=A0A6M3LKJ7_9ZZZZ
MTVNKGTVIMKCDCKNTAQDDLYGEGMRVHNMCSVNKVENKNARCTVCQKVKAA